MFNLFNKKKYLNCPNMQHTLHFFYDKILSCCTNTPGPIFYDHYTGGEIDWDYVYKKRKNYIKQINSPFNKIVYPACCEDCCERNNYIQENKIINFDNKVNKIYFHNFMSCNAKCSYCTYSCLEKGSKYNVLPLVKSLIQNNILSKQALIYMSGGEITISPEFEELLSVLSDYVESRIEILTSGIKYCESIKQSFIKDRCRLVISIDSSCRDTYKKIKNVDAFDKVVENIKKYVEASEYTKDCIVLKYIIVDGVNDNETEICNFVKLAKNLQLKTVRLDFDYEKYKFSEKNVVPKSYFDLYDIFYKVAKEENLKIQECDQIQAILEQSKKQLNIE